MALARDAAGPGRGGGRFPRQGWSRCLARGNPGTSSRIAARCCADHVAAVQLPARLGTETPLHPAPKCPCRQQPSWPRSAGTRLRIPLNWTFAYLRHLILARRADCWRPMMLASGRVVMAVCFAASAPGCGACRWMASVTSRPDDPPILPRPASLMVADAVRHMSVHSRKQSAPMDIEVDHQAKSSSPRGRGSPAHGPFPQVVAGVGFEPA